jgi:DNA-binding MarR family transcriptional regulator
MAEDVADTAAQVLAELVPRLARVIAGALEADPEVALSLRQYRILERLAERPHRTTELATTSGVTQPTASAAVTSLETRGLVARAADPDDRRATLIALTDAGQAILDTAKDRILDRLRLVTAEMSEADAAALGRLQPILVAGMDRAREQLRGERLARDRQARG